MMAFDFPVAVILKRLAAPLWVFSFMYFGCFRAPARTGLWSKYRN
jgi:hypothetical protein